MVSISDEEFDRLLTGFRRHAIHLETRDAYGTAVELPHLAKWAAGEPDDLEWLQARMFGILAESAVNGRAARDIVTRIIDELG
jgi:hypothetical protein